MAGEKNAGGEAGGEAVRATLLQAPADAGKWGALAALLPGRRREYLARAICCAPGDFRFHANHSNCCLAEQCISGAWLSLRRAALLEPGFRRAYVNMGGLCTRQAAARDFFSRAWSLGADTRAGLAMARRLLLSRNAPGPAAEVLSRVLAEAPLCSAAWQLAGMAAARVSGGDYGRAKRAFCRALLADPANSDTCLEVFHLFMMAGEHRRASRLLDFAECLAPGTRAVLSGRFIILERRGCHDEGFRIARQLAVRVPADAEIWLYNGTIRHSAGAIGEALAYLARARLIAPADARIRNVRAHLLLKTGQFREGFAEYEYRWGSLVEEGASSRVLGPVPSFDLPLRSISGFSCSSGSPRPPGSGDHVLVWGEQGLGDEVWGLSRLGALLADGAARGECFTVEADARLVPLIERAFPEVAAIGRDPEMLPDTGRYQAQVPLLSLSHALGLEGVPPVPGYLRPPEDRVKAARACLDAYPGTGAGGRGGPGPGGRIVGLGWRSDKPRAYRSFALPPDGFAPLGALPGVRFLPLQYNVTEQEWQELEAVFGAERLIRPGFDTRNDLEALVTAIAAIDAVATVATALVPFAIAAGTPSVVRLRKVQADWRYIVGADRADLLPGATLIWPGEGNVGARMRDALAALLA